MPDIEELAIIWVESEDAEVLNQLIVASTPYVDSLVASVSNPVPHLVSLEELQHVGMIALVESLKTYNPEKSRFKTWSYKRIKGAAQDAIKQMNPMSRTRSVHMQSIESAESQLIYESPEDNFLTSLPENASSSLILALQQLPSRQRITILFLLNGLQSKQISQLLEISPSQVRQDRKKAIEILSELLEEKLEITIKSLS